MTHFFTVLCKQKTIRKVILVMKEVGMFAFPLLIATNGGQLPDTDSGYLVSVIVGVLLLVGGIILLRLQKNS